MKKSIFTVGVLFGTLLSVGSASAAVSYTVGLKVDDISNYGPFGLGTQVCTDAGGGSTYAIDDSYGCDAAGFELVDILPSQEETFQLGADSIVMTVDGIKDEGEVISASVEIRLFAPQTFYPLSAVLKAGTETEGGFEFTYNDITGAYESSFDFCVMAQGSSCKGISNVEITFSTVPVPAAAWLFGSALIGLAGLKRKQS